MYIQMQYCIYIYYRCICINTGVYRHGVYLLVADSARRSRTERKDGRHICNRPSSGKSQRVSAGSGSCGQVVRDPHLMNENRNQLYETIFQSVITCLTARGADDTHDDVAVNLPAGQRSRLSEIRRLFRHPIRPLLLSMTSDEVWPLLVETRRHFPKHRLQIRPERPVADGPNTTSKVWSYGFDVLNVPVTVPQMQHFFRGITELCNNHTI